MACQVWMPQTCAFKNNCMHFKGLRMRHKSGLRRFFGAFQDREIWTRFVKTDRIIDWKNYVPNLLLSSSTAPEFDDKMSFWCKKPSKNMQNGRFKGGCVKILNCSCFGRFKRAQKSGAHTSHRRLVFFEKFNENMKKWKIVKAEIKSLRAKVAKP